ncbi:hypothetical protein FIBSPDRAFT_312428 [Athelia psychrophila]|uniref:Secreted protein n=1 Tax=Athelia psychrophila TaxID=1759441 RepID=A0A166WDI7_9AGAM|nr:hypothetical protein FIBSPDRAFT_312428 [Fibularhizoctonia sp. CBS 109695]
MMMMLCAAVSLRLWCSNSNNYYSVILFPRTMINPLTLNCSSSPDQLLAALLPCGAAIGTDYTSVIQNAQAVTENNWSTERFHLTKCIEHESSSFSEMESVRFPIKRCKTCAEQLCNAAERFRFMLCRLGYIVELLRRAGCSG